MYKSLSLSLSLHTNIQPRSCGLRRTRVVRRSAPRRSRKWPCVLFCVFSRVLIFA